MKNEIGRKIGMLIVCIISLFVLLSPTTNPLFAAAVSQTYPLSTKDKQFLDDVYWIISDYEKNAFLSLKTQEDRDRFVDAFWDDRDPTPGTKENEFKDEHYRRIVYANNWFGRESSIPGWKTDRGQIYILFGKPQFTRRIPNSHDIQPVELWHYVGISQFALPRTLYFLFFQRNGIPPYKLYDPQMDGLQKLVRPLNQFFMKEDQVLLDYIEQNVDPEVAHAALSFLPMEGGLLEDQGRESGTVTTEVVLGQVANARNYDVSKRTYVDDILKDRPNVKVYYSIGRTGVRNGLYWFQAPNGNFYLDYAVEYEPNKMDMGNYEDTYYTSLTLDGQISTSDKTIAEFITGNHEIKMDKQQFEQIQSLPFQYEGRKPIVPGKYLFTLIVNNNVSRQSITFTQDFEIPDPDSLKTPYLTPTMLVRSVEDATQEQDKRLRPFQFGQKLYVPNLPAKYTQKGMKVYHQVIFPTQFKAQGTVSMRYTILNGDKVDLQVTDPVKLTSEQLSATAIDVLKDIQLSQIGGGARKLVVEVLDGDKVLTRADATPFTIEPDANLGVWKFAVSIPGFDSPYHNVTLAAQYQRLNKPQEAMQLLEKVQATHPDVLPIEVELMRASLRAKDYKKVIEIGTPLEVKDPRNSQLLWFMGWAYYGQGKYDDAVRFFERYRMEDPNKVEALNVLADSYYRLNEPSKSLQRIQESLAIKPNQQDLLKLKQNLESAQHQQ